MTAATCPSCGSPVRPDARFCRSCGHARTTAADTPQDTVDRVDPVSPPTPAVTPETGELRRAWWRSRRLHWAVGGVLLLALGGTYAVSAVSSAATPPTGPVRDLFDALTARDGARVATLISCPTAPLCTATGLASGYTPPTAVEIGAVTYGDPTDATRRPNKDTATVAVRYRLADGEHTDTVQLLRTRTGLITHWQINRAPGLGAEVVSTTVRTAQVAGAEVTTVSEPTSGPPDLWLLPGSYTVTTTATALRTAQPTTVHAAGDGTPQNITLDLAMRPEIVDTVRQQVRTRIDACAQVDDLRPDTGGGLLRNCPWSVSAPSALVQDVRWTVLDYPEIELRESDDDTVTVHTVRPGHVRADFRYSLDLVGAKDFRTASETTTVTISGEVETSGNTVTWTG